MSFYGVERRLHDDFADSHIGLQEQDSMRNFFAPIPPVTNPPLPDVISIERIGYHHRHSQEQAEQRRHSQNLPMALAAKIELPTAITIIAN